MSKSLTELGPEADAAQARLGEVELGHPDEFREALAEAKRTQVAYLEAAEEPVIPGAGA